ncbi:MAG: hypothetical protein OSB21_12110, partial [Myxococcota bacterium]|nr:hypothetical protein [Myxococcota bacterium]
GLYEAPAAQIYGAGERWRRFVGCWRDTCYALSAQGQVWRLDRRTKRKISRITSLPISTDLIGTSRDFCVLSEAGTLHCGRDGHRFIQLPLTGIRAVQSTPDLSWLFIDKHQGEDLLLNLPRSNSSSPTRFGTLVSELANSDTLEIIAPDAPDNRTAIRRVARPGTPPSLKGAAKLQNDAWLVLTEDQRVLSWGNSRLLAREGDATPAAEITALRGSFMLGGRDPYCVINQDRRLVCWGSNSRGKMGIPIQEQTPFRVQLDSTVRQVALGSGHTCALNDNGTIDCWGGSEVVGAGLTTQRIYARPTLIPNFGQIERVQGRGNTTCADNAQNHLFCWGSGSQGQFGIGSITHYYRPERLTQWAHLRDLRVGRTRFCGLNDQGVVYCAGELGIPAEPGSRYSLRSAEPVALPDLPAIAQLSVGQPVCGLTAEGQLFCWGQSIALFGDRNPRRPQAIAQAPAATTAYANLSDGFPSYAAICIQTVAGETMCSSHEGPLSTLAVPPSPVVAIDMGGCNCMLLEDRTVWCWGPDWTHQCEGNQCLEPTQVPGLPPITQIAVGLAHACAVGADGSLWCWGDNTSGQLGNGVHGRDYQYPTLIDGY